MAAIPDGSANILNKPTFVERGFLKFLIMDAPTDGNIQAYIQVLSKRKVAAVVLACEPSYNTIPLTDAGIHVEDLPFADGGVPPAATVSRWLALVADIVGKDNKDEKAIAVHCVAGLGRAPVLVAIALLEYGMDAPDAVAFIRKRRRGAINRVQLEYLNAYKSKKPAGCCVLM
mmetsp:Transcript_25268/g.28020  ORF Transcript_25268/g.28020 Transcript_25268/m.28020 type:complete len:173 (+) Transcript_25268:167-685(+)|eukprot:CAMPEP_0205828186 /NCGR_PEP_ID=MMETSP0206-20130828/34295_1 /ASSEMBLY_ACC=CAM_ASM_000279 /TAXON_ID=36767 /ORGANISM="Euplotes focardii, Strain TN1" /LENGTH=172 /DNA_ID=CAMNT_0053129739 /DNA_START=167 /DNA_END=685 /DNA_ORIENTATION=+